MIITFTYGDPDPGIRDAIAKTLRLVLQYKNATLYADNFTGQGEWTDTDTGTAYTEHSGVIVADVPDLSPGDLKHLRYLVAEIAITYDQDAIGFIPASSTDTLVTPHEARH